MSKFKTVVLLCEGNADVAFLRKVLKLDGYRDYREVIKEMVSPLNQYFENKFSDYDYIAKELFDSPMLPMIMKRTEGQKNDFILLYSLDGLFNEARYREIIQDFIIMSSQHIDPGSLFDKGTRAISLGFVCDIDDKGTESRIKYFQEKFSDLIEELKYISEYKDVTNASVFKSVGIHCYPEEKKGEVLEDILIPIMEKGNENLFISCRKYFDEIGFVSKGTKMSSDQKKALVGCVGQKFVPGVNNSTIILKSGLLNGKITGVDEAVRIIKYVKKLRDLLYK